MENIIEVENDMKFLSKKAVTSSPTKSDFHDESSIDVELSPLKGDKSDKDISLSLKIDANESTEVKKHVTNGLLTFSTPLQQSNRFQFSNNLSAFQVYRNLMLYNSTPKSNEKAMRKPRVNFHSIDDIVYGGKNSEDDVSNCDSGYQTNSVINLSNSASFNKSPVRESPANNEKVKSNSIDETEHHSDNEADNDENVEVKTKQNTNTNNINNKKIRTTFSDNQKWMLEQYYRRNPYPDPRETEDLSKQLSLPENVIKVWFQNKRSRDKQRKSANKTNNNDFATQLNNLQFLTNALAPFASNQVISGFY